MATQENVQVPGNSQSAQVKAPEVKAEPTLTTDVSKNKPQGPTNLPKNTFSSFIATLPPKTKMIFKIAAGVVVILLVLLFISSIVNAIRLRTQQGLPSPSPRPYTTPSVEEISAPSRYATDAGILKIKDDLGSIDRDLGSMDMKEINLSLPQIDFNIKFDK
jgi:hypothetical protein